MAGSVECVSCKMRMRDSYVSAHGLCTGCNGAFLMWAGERVGENEAREKTALATWLRLREVGCEVYVSK